MARTEDVAESKPTSPSGFVTLLTDFGLADPFVGVMKGVLLRRHPELRVLDATHQIPPQDVTTAAYWLERSFRYYPGGTVHVAVVDPGVGTSRRALVAEGLGYWFVAPDNGLLTGIVQQKDVSLREIDLALLDSQGWAFGKPSRTFHGRDVFAPVAAELASGRLTFDAVGPPARDPIILPAWQPSRRDDQIVGRVVTIDHFGNAITNISVDHLAGLRHPLVRTTMGTFPVRQTYAEAARGQPLALINAFGSLEIAVREGHAASSLGIELGAEVVLSSRAATADAEAVGSRDLTPRLASPK